MTEIRAATAVDVRRIVAIHKEAFPGFFLTMLGDAFLTRFYAAMVHEPLCISLLAERDDAVVGFVLGPLEPAGFFRRLLVRDGPGFVLDAMPALLSHPLYTSRRLFRGLGFRGEAPPGQFRAALISSIAVEPASTGKGIAGKLIEAFCATAARLQASHVYLTTDRDHNESVNRFYAGHGFYCDSRMTRSDGRVMNRYVRTLEGRAPGISAVETSEARTESEAIPALPFALPDIGEEEISEVVATLRSGWITTGPKTRQFELDFRSFLQDDTLHCIAVNSATAGLHLALEAIGIGPGDEVIVPTHTFTATAEVVRYLGADPKFVDIDIATYCLDPQCVDAAAGPRTRAIMPVHYGGLAADMHEISRMAARRDIRVIEDAAHAFPTRHHGRLIGTLESAATVFSFYATKTIATGEGGMLVTRDPAIAHRAKIMRLHGIDRDAFDRYRSTKPAWYYEVVAPGYKYNLTDLAAALGVAQLRKANAFQERREALATRYHQAFADLPLVLPPLPQADSTHSWHLYVVRLGNDVRLARDEAIERLYQAGIGCSVHYVPLHLQPYWRDRYALAPDDFPNSQLLFERGISLPIYTRMTDADQERVIRAVRGLF